MNKSRIKTISSKKNIFLLSSIFVVLTVLIKIPITTKAQTPKTYSDLFSYLDRTNQKVTVTSKKEWEMKRRQILYGMQKAMGTLPDTLNLPPVNIQYRDSLKTDTYTRYLISFTPAANEDVTAYLYIPSPKEPGKKIPAMLVLHGTGALGKRLVDGESAHQNRAQATELAERGYVVIAPDYPSMGEQKDYDFDKDRYESGTMKGIFNHIRCVDLLVQRKDVDPERLGVIGHSLGGHNAMFVAAFDTRLKVIVSSSGWTLLDYYRLPGRELESERGPYGGERYMPLYQKYYFEENRKPFELDELIAVLAPRAFFSNSPIGDDNFDVRGVRKGVASAIEVYRFFDSEDKLQVRYPDAAHDFPKEVRFQAYAFIDKILEFASKK